MIIVNRQTFTNRFASAAAAVPSRTPKDVLKNILFVSDGKKILLSATDSEIHLRTEMPYEGEKASSLIPSARMLGILRELTADDLKLTIAPGKMRIQCGFADYNLGTMPPDDFPPVPVFDAESYFTVDPLQLADAIRKTIFSVDVSNTSFALGGIQIEVTDKLVLASTYSRRLGLVTIDAANVNNAEWNNAKPPLVPTGAMKLVASTIEPGTPVKLACTQNSVSFKIGDTSLSANLLGGKFPNYRRVITDPKDFTQKMVIPIGPFASILKQVLIMASEESRGIDFVFGKNQLTVKSQSADIGDATAEMPLANENPPITMRLQGVFVAEMLKCLDPISTVDVGIISEDERVMFTNGNYQHVIMPTIRD